ncbi:hypothetical protein MHYP_G00276840 [Metynnis hypsauchen]
MFKILRNQCGMRLSLLLMFLLALACSYDLPCKGNYSIDSYNIFSAKHILPQGFTNSEDNWIKHLQKQIPYLNNERLCGRKPLQTFFRNADENAVKNICNNQGFEYGAGNLCISQEIFSLYIVESEKTGNGCKINKVREINNDNRLHVVVGCGKVINTCLPVHFHTQTSEAPHNRIVCCC